MAISDPPRNFTSTEKRLEAECSAWLGCDSIWSFDGPLLALADDLARAADARDRRRERATSRRRW
jgi:hypothetical protein